jgi:hypothetical protein
LGVISTFVYDPQNLNRKLAKIIPKIDEKFYRDRFLNPEIIPFAEKQPGALSFCKK